MKKVKMFVYNYGRIELVANFGNNSHDAVKCMESLNRELVDVYGYIPNDIFYYLRYTIKERVCLFINAKGMELHPNEDTKQMRKLTQVN